MNLIERQVLQCIESAPMLSQQELAKRLGITEEQAAAAIASLQAQGHIAGRGYVVSEGSYVVVVGGVNVDIAGTPSRKLIPADSNPGFVRMSLGGVGRNIAHNLAVLGTDTRMLTAYGDDMNGQRVGASCSELGIDMRHARLVPGATTSTYLYITDENGEMTLAISDMAVCEHITPEYLEENRMLLNRAQLVVADTNIPRESLRYLAENVNVPIFCDPVSTIKAEKLKDILHGFHTLKPNRIEAELLSGVKIESREDAVEAGRALLNKGLRRVFISMGADGVCAVSHQGELWLPPLMLDRVNTTGCGDAYMAGLVWAYLQGSDLAETTAAGAAAASIAMETESTINPSMSEALLRQRITQALRAL